MYRYLYVDRSQLKKRLTPKTTYVWIPAQVLRFSECKPKELFIVDCFFRNLIDNPYISLILLRKIPKPKEVIAYETPPIDAKKIDAECKDIVGDFYRIVDEVISRNFEKLLKLVDTITEYKDVEFTVRYFIRARRYVIKAEKLREIDKRIAVRSTERIMNHLCLYNKKENTKSFTSVNIDKYYVLAYIDPLLQTSGLVIGKHFVEVNTYLKLVKKLSLGDLFDLEYPEPSVGTHR